MNDDYKPKFINNPNLTNPNNNNENKEIDSEKKENNYSGLQFVRPGANLNNNPNNIYKGNNIDKLENTKKLIRKNNSKKIILASSIGVIISLIVIIIIVGVIRYNKKMYGTAGSKDEVKYEEVFNGTLLYDEYKFKDKFDITMPSEFINTLSNNNSIIYEYKSDMLNCTIKLSVVSNFSRAKDLAYTMAMHYNVPSPFEKKINNITWYNLKYVSGNEVSMNIAKVDDMVFTLEMIYDNSNEFIKYENQILYGIKLK